MTTHLFRLFFSLIFLFQLPGLSAATCTIPGTERSCDELVSELPWSFIIHIREKDPVRITYMSSKGRQQLNPNLKMFLEVSDHENREEATETFSRIRQEAHPDMGLSYGWDLVLVKEKLIYRLHADCTLAEQYFTAMAKSLEGLLVPPGKRLPHTLFCRCGGGCKLFE